MYSLVINISSMCREVEWVKLCAYIDAPVTNHLIQFYRKIFRLFNHLNASNHNHFQKAKASSFVCLENSFFYCRLFNNTSIILWKYLLEKKIQLFTIQINNNYIFCLKLIENYDNSKLNEKVETTTNDTFCIRSSMNYKIQKFPFQWSHSKNI